ncbi:hypothetical protein CVT26_014857 [Gymnopilus dilepis]|uniref:Cyanovirin-N domain-containing protein n=1 Tax=Gymnopilus dilepis TaxID=231916 RepID=A0A409XX27_9AGAR|nr:hypothetical protein CVT26_014857 [Gymnopilus dilepis]
MKLTAVFFSTLIAFAVASSDEANAGSCSNTALIGPNNQNYAKQGCVSSRSKGWRSSHNCADKSVGGKAYLCVQNNVTTCISGTSNVKAANLENGDLGSIFLPVVQTPADLLTTQLNMKVAFFILSLIALAAASEDEAQGSCSNVAKIGAKNKNYAKQGCVNTASKGFLSSHNCFSKGGRAYLCVQGGRTTCISGANNVKAANLENGECFI